MDKEHVQAAVLELKKEPARKFVQSYDLVINLKNLEIKQTPLDFFVTLHYPKSKGIKIAAFVDQELVEQAGKFCDLTIREADFSRYADKKVQRKLAEDHDYFIAQANLMPKIAAAFGKVLGTRGKMPNPKLGCVVPPNANLQPLTEKLKKTVRLVAKKGMNLQCIVGKQDMPDEQVIDNVLTVYQTTLKQLPNEMQNVKNVVLKFTMGKPVKV